MVEDTINKYRGLTEDLRAVKGVEFFAVVKMDDLTDRWSLVFGLLGAKDLDKREKVFTKIRDIIIEHLSQEDMQDIARISLFATTEHLIKDLMGYAENEDIKDVRANGNFIHNGHVFISPHKTPEAA